MMSMNGRCYTDTDYGQPHLSVYAVRETAALAPPETGVERIAQCVNELLES